MWVVFLVWILCGILLLVAKRTQNKRGFIIIKMMGASFLVFGMVGMIGVLVGNERMCGSGVLFPTASALIGTARLVKAKKRACKMCVEAKCTNYVSYYGGRGQTAYAPVFAYTYEGRAYESQSPLSYSKKKIAKKYITGQMYQIYINPEYPQDCIDTKHISIGYYIMELLGWGLFVLTIFLLLK